MGSQNSLKAYELTPVKVGCEVRGINLKEDVSHNVINEIKEDVTNHRLLIFKDQGIIDGSRHVEIAKWFNEPDSTFYKHEKSPHPDVFRVSNDRREGCTNVGRTGWHIDGSFQQHPFSHSLYHMVNVPKNGPTVFCPLTDLIESVSQETLSKWERLYMVSDRRTGPVHPMVYSHPISKMKVLCFHLGMTVSFAYDYGSKSERLTSVRETQEILEEIHNEIVKDDRRLVYSHKWCEGDFIISDNLALGHEAAPETQFPSSKVGLRVLHRVTTKGNSAPKK